VVNDVRYSAGEAARLLGISVDTLRRWDRAGRIRVERDAANRRFVRAAEVARVRGAEPHPSSARNRFPGIVSDVQVDGLLAQVEIVSEGTTRILAVITREAATELGLKPGMPATAFVKATSVMVEG
jgi:molybdopterin-binding protein